MRTRALKQALLVGAKYGIDAAETCQCGWKLPEGVTPFRVSKDTAREQGWDAEDNVIPDAGVALRCPDCGAGHGFFSPTASVAAGYVKGGSG